MSDDDAPAMAETVIPFTPRPVASPELVSCELRLLDGDILEMTVCDETQQRYCLCLGFLGVPQGFDLERLREAWTRWREVSAIAS